MVPSAHIVHNTPGRTRLRIPSRRKDQDYFRDVMDTLVKDNRVDAVEYGHHAGSLLIFHRMTLDQLGSLAADLRLFELVRQEVQQAVSKRLFLGIDGKINRLEERLAGVSDGQLDLILLTFGGMIGAGLVQCMRGNMFPPGSTLITKAVNLLYATYKPERSIDSFQASGIANIAQSGSIESSRGGS